MRRGWWVIASIVLVVIAVSVLLELRDVPEPSSPVPALAEVSDRREASLELADPSESTDDPVRAAAAPSPSEAPTLTDSSEEASPGGRLAGHLVVVDSSGRRHEEEDGRLKLVLEGDGTAELVELAVREGRWEISLPERPSAIEVWELLARGRIALPASKRASVPAEGPVVIEAVWPPAVELHVIDRDTEVALGDLVVVRAAPEESVLHHPGRYSAEELWAEGMDSPVLIEPRDRHREVLWVRAPGYAWGRVSIEFGEERRRVLSMARSGELTVWVEGARPDDEGWLRLYGERGGLPRLELELPTDGPAFVSNLEPGTYLVAAERGAWATGLQRLAEAKVAVRPNQPAEVTLRLEEDRGEDPGAVFAGTIEVGAGWEEELRGLVIEPLDPKVRVVHLSASDLLRRQEGTFRWGAGRVPPGTYRVIVLPYQHQRVFEVGIEGLPDADLFVPDPAEVRLRVMEAGTGDAAAVPWISWRAAGAKRSAPDWVSLDEGAEAFVFQAPPGEIEVEIATLEHDAPPRVLEVYPGTNTFEWEVERSCGVVLTFRDGEGEVPVSWSGIDLQEIGGEGRSRTWTGRSPVTVLVTNPGRYRLEIPEIDGYETVPVREVTIGAGERVPVTIDLRRR